MTIIPIACFLDNYIWCLQADGHTWVVDPGDAAAVERHLAAQARALSGILLTHHHADHTGGVAALVERHRVPVYGPDETAAWHSHAVSDGEVLALPGLGRATVLFVGAHTRGHVAYYFPDGGHLFCGDTLFSAGCGRLFEGDSEDLARALDRLNALPADTRIYPTHEYTRANLAFARRLEPDNADIRQHIDQVDAWWAAQQPSLPSTLALERRINPFLRSREPAVVAAASAHAGCALPPGTPTLKVLRAWKDVFRPED